MAKPVMPKQVELEAPEWWDHAAWLDWEEWRRTERKKKLTQKAANLQYKNLQKACTQGQDMREIIERSIANDWQGLFPLNGNGKPKKHPSGLQPTPDPVDMREAMEIQEDILDSIQLLRENAELEEILESGGEIPKHFVGALNILASQIEKYENRFNNNPLPPEGREWFEEVCGALRASDE